MKEKANNTKRQADQKRKRESILLEELCRNHGYMFADSLPKKDRLTIMMTTSGSGKRTICSAPALKLVVPDGSALGMQILEMRNAKTKAKATPKTGAKMRPLAKIGAGPR